MEFSGSLADLGVTLPLILGLIMINKLDPISVLLFFGIFYIATGLYYKTVVPVEPMKAISGVAITLGLSQTQIAASGLIMGLFLLFIGLTRLIELIGKYTPKSTIRGVQFAVGVSLMLQGLGYAVKPDPNLVTNSVNILGTPVGVGLILGLIPAAVIFLFVDNKKIPAAIVVLVFGIVAGIFLTEPPSSNIKLGLRAPTLFPYGFPQRKRHSIRNIHLSDTPNPHDHRKRHHIQCRPLPPLLQRKS